MTRKWCDFLTSGCSIKCCNLRVRLGIFKTKIYDPFSLKGKQWWFCSLWLYFLHFRGYLFCIMFKVWKPKRPYMYRIFSAWKKKFSLLDTTPKLSNLAFGGPLQQAGFWSSLDTRFAVFMFWAHLSSEVSFPHISKRFSECWHLGSTVDCIARRKGIHWQSWSNGKLSPVCWKMDPILPHTLRESLTCALVLQTSFPGLRLTSRAGQPSHSSCFSCGICELIPVGSDCHICTSNCIYLAGLLLRLDLTASWLYSVWHMHAMWLRCCLSCCSYACVGVGLIASCVQGIVVPFFSQGSSVDQAESWWDAFASPLSDAVLLSVAWEGGRCMLNWQFYWAAFQPRGKLTSNLCSFI